MKKFLLTLALLIGLAYPAAAQQTNAQIFNLTTGPCKLRSGSGSPEGVVTGNKCDMYLRSNGGTDTTLYVKESGTGNTGWAPRGGGASAWTNPMTSAAVATIISDETGSGLLVFATSPVLTTPNLGTPSALVLTNATGTPSSIGLANGTGLPVSTGISGLGSGVATFLATPSSANLAAAVTGETGSGAVVFGTAPTIDAGVFTTSMAVGAGVPTAAIPIFKSFSRNGQIQEQLINTNVGVDNYVEFLVKAKDTNSYLGAEPANSSDTFGAGRGYVVFTSAGAGANTAGGDFFACTGASPAGCYYRFITNSTGAGGLRLTIDATGLTTASNAIIDVPRTALVTTSTDGFVTENTTAATSGVTVQISPRSRWRGTAWDTSASQTVDFFAEVLPATAATPTGTWKLGYSLNGAAASYPFQVNSAGSGVFAGSVTLNPNSGIAYAARFATYSTAAKLYQWTDVTGATGGEQSVGTPTLGTCTGGSLTSGSHNFGGEVTGTTGGSCVINFGTPNFTNTPLSCWAGDQTAGGVVNITARSASSITIGNITSGHDVMWGCTGRIGT